MATDDQLYTMHIPATGEVKEFTIPDPIAQVLAEDAAARRPQRLSEAERYSVTNPVVLCERTGQLQKQGAPVVNSVYARIAELERCLALSNAAQTKLAKQHGETRASYQLQRNKNSGLRYQFHKVLDMLVHLQKEGLTNSAADKLIARMTEGKSK